MKGLLLESLETCLGGAYKYWAWLLDGFWVGKEVLGLALGLLAGEMLGVELIPKGVADLYAWLPYINV